MMAYPRNCNARMQAGEGSKPEASASAFSGKAAPAVKTASMPRLLDQHYCCCRAGAVCVFCLQWNRRIRGIEARRAASLRRQALGGRIRAGG